jgi:hypothetical protein
MATTKNQDRKEYALETLLVRLKPYDPRRGFVLRRFTYKGIKFQEERGWYRVEKQVADYLAGVRQVEHDAHSPSAFDVQSDEEAKALDAREESEAKTRKNALEAPRVSVGRGDLTSDDLRAVAPSRAPVAAAAVAVGATAIPRAEADKAKKDRV